MKKKSNPQEFTTRKRKKGVFDATLFVKFKDDISKNQHNTFVKRHGRPDCQVDVANIQAADKPLPKLPRQ